MIPIGTLDADRGEEDEVTLDGGGDVVVVVIRSGGGGPEDISKSSNDSQNPKSPNFKYINPNSHFSAKIKS